MPGMHPCLRDRLGQACGPRLQFAAHVLHEVLSDPGGQDALTGAGFVKVVSQRGRQLRRSPITSRAAQCPAREASGLARMDRALVI